MSERCSGVREVIWYVSMSRRTTAQNSNRLGVGVVEKSTRESASVNSSRAARLRRRLTDLVGPGHVRNMLPGMGGAQLRTNGVHFKIRIRFKLLHHEDRLKGTYHPSYPCPRGVNRVGTASCENGILQCDKCHNRSSSSGEIKRVRQRGHFAPGLTLS